MRGLRKRKCVPCEGDILPLKEHEIQHYLSQVSGWSLKGKWITKEYRFRNFVRALRFVNKVADLAEAEGHHPDIYIHYNRVRLNIWTHAIDGLSENDFILADKIDALR